MLMTLPWSLLALMVSEAWAGCDNKTIESIRASWGGHPPYDITLQLQGKTTELYQPSYKYMNSDTDLLCHQVDYTGLFDATDSYLYKNSSHDYFTSYEVVEEEPGVLSVVASYGPDGHMYTIFLCDGVFAYYQCRPDCEDAYEGCSYEPFVIVAVLDYHRMTAEKELAIKQAHEKIKEVGLELGPKIPTVCPTIKG